MRKIAFISKYNTEGIVKIMLSPDDSLGVYMFGYDTKSDIYCKYDWFYDNLADAEKICYDEYGVKKDDWIYVKDVPEDCFDDFIMPVRLIKGCKPRKYEIFLDGKWRNYPEFLYKAPFNGLSGNERLSISGLEEEFKQCKKHDKIKAQKIFEGLGFTPLDIKRTLYPIACVTHFSQKPDI
jgi:hypothetical protein